MFETTFSHASAKRIPPEVNIEQAIPLLHDFESIIKLNPDCRGCQPIPPPTQKNGYANKTNGVSEKDRSNSNKQFYEVADDLPFMPKKLWSGGVRYVAEFLPTDDGCDITVHAPGGFTSVNHWRILKETIPEDEEATLERVKSKDLLNHEPNRGGWYVQIVSDAKCGMAFSGIVKGFLKNSHTQQETAFIEKLKTPIAQRSRRPTLGRRKSSQF